MAEVRMVVGLGNPGPRYANTRHNAGFKVIDSVSEALSLEVRKKKFGGAFGEGAYKDKKLILLKPWEFMNRSGQVVATAVGFYKLDPCDLLVISDDMALDPGRIRLRAKGSAGGHKGLADVIENLGTEEFSRLRIGIGPSGGLNDVDFVLGEPTEHEKRLLNEAIERAREAVICWLENGVEAAMNAFNSL
jgi:PTH1 family peptidyl-tRNA hydrolase